MPVDWEKVERLRAEKFGSGRLGEPGIRGFVEALDGMMSYESYRGYLEQGIGRRPIGASGGIPLRYVEALADALDVPLGDLLNGATRSAEYERGVRNGRLQALAEVHSILNDLLRGEDASS